MTFKRVLRPKALGLSNRIGMRQKASKRSQEAWIKAIPPNPSHGSGTLQKRLWRLVSDYTRIRDWYLYGRCVASGKPLGHWKEGQGGHFIHYSKCNGIFKFSEKNVFLQDAESNAWGGMEIGHAFGAELERRGIDTDALRAENRDTEKKLNDTLVISKIEDILGKMIELPEKPEYFDRVIELRSNYRN